MRWDEGGDNIEVEGKRGCVYVVGVMRGMAGFICRNGGVGYIEWVDGRRG